MKTPVVSSRCGAPVAPLAKFHNVRQDGIDEELFDVIAGFEALNTS